MSITTDVINFWSQDGEDFRTVTRQQDESRAEFVERATQENEYPIPDPDEEALIPIVPVEEVPEYTNAELSRVDL